MVQCGSPFGKISCLRQRRITIEIGAQKSVGFIVVAAAVEAVILHHNKSYDDRVITVPEVAGKLLSFKPSELPPFIDGDRHEEAWDLKFSAVSKFGISDLTVQVGVRCYGCKPGAHNWVSWEVLVHEPEDTNPGGVGSRSFGSPGKPMELAEYDPYPGY